MQNTWEETANGTFFPLDVCTCTSLFFMLTTSPSIQARFGSSTQTWEPTMILTGAPCERNSAIINEMSRKTELRLCLKHCLPLPPLLLISLCSWTQHILLNYYRCDLSSVWYCDWNYLRNSILTTQWVGLWTWWICLPGLQGTEDEILDKKWNQFVSEHYSEGKRGRRWRIQLPVEWSYNKVSKEIAHNNSLGIWQTARADLLPTKHVLGLTQ